MRVLIVEDEAPLREQLVDTLKQNNYTVDAVGDGSEAVYQGVEYSYDVAILDIGLPDITGIEVLKEWRKQDKNFPVLILTARGHWQDKVDGLGAGADDYLVKPFHLEELIARLNALIRRSAGFAQSTIESGEISLDTISKRVTCKGEPVELTAYEYNVLEYLMLNPGKIVSKTELTEHLYAQDYDRDSNVIEVFVRRLRRKLDPDSTLKPIETLRGQGYRLNTSNPS